MLQIADIIGIIGTITLIYAYTITTYPIFYLSKKQIIIDLLNIFGSFTVGYNCIYYNNYPPLILEIFWFIIATISFIKHIYIKFKKPKENKILNNKFVESNYYSSI